VANGNILFLLAHQDDEYFIAPFIVREKFNGNLINCVYLTDGSGYGIDPQKRDKESLNALSSLGVEEREVIFLGNESGVKDSTAMIHCQIILDGLIQQIGDKRYCRIYCPAWEGGHTDHDAVHLVALAFAKTRNLVNETWQFSMYNAYRVPKLFFRVMYLFDLSQEIQTEVIKFPNEFKFAFLFRFYRSQWKTWIGLSPQSIFKFLFVRRMKIQLASIKKTFHRPHDGSLLYEKRFGIMFDYFMEQTRNFRNYHFDK